MSNLIQIKKNLEKYNKIPKKSLGQNFLINPEITKKIAGLCLGDGVIEIGPGLGALTFELCKIYKKVVAVEIDKTFEPLLNEPLSDCNNIKIIFGDILKIDLRDLIQKEFAGFERINICANLPYYITTPVILKLIKSCVKYNAITVMIQKEAADKFCSKAGEKNYNATSAIINYYGEAKKIFSVAKSNFYPQPNVLSTVVKITPHEVPIANPKSEDLMYKIINFAFEHRRKTLVNALITGLNINMTDKNKIADIVKKIAGEKSENIRGEELDIKAFSDISDLIYHEIKYKINIK
ncbi:MAG: 16S rRNA (adenine(1518)-N(6)/adenine(1519)-N(6))-dimethyltransferase RsmA [Oscillospiraceae bacterium]|nr:16S rRNA (adenine(1518)-N(6)/adenine(1519)-N(6))-dimethyltransferase RsmA [Oscillospiraceae bacterium]